MPAPPSLDRLMLGRIAATEVLASVQSLIGAKCVGEVSEYADLVVYARTSETAAGGKLQSVIQFLARHQLEYVIDTPREGVLRIEISTRFG